MQTYMSTDSLSERGQITVAVFVGCVIGFLAIGMLIGSFLGTGLMKLSQYCKRKIDISIKKMSSKSDIDRSSATISISKKFSKTIFVMCLSLPPI